jgi:hypothetical protein
MKKKILQHSLSFLSLFSSFGTLFCCALPALFVLLGAGAVFAGLTSTVPQITFIAEHKNGIFIFAGTMISLNLFLRFKNRYNPCPTDPNLANSCKKLKKISNIIFYVSVIFFFIGLSFAYLVPYFLN